MDETLYQQEYGSVFAYLLQRCGNWHVAEDLTSATFERALLLVPHTNPHALLLSIARHKVLTYWATERKRRTYAFADVFDLAEEDRYAVLAVDGGMDRIIETCDTAMAAAMLRAMLATLSPAELQMIDLRFVQSLSAKETAARLGLTPQEYNRRQATLFNRLARRINPAPPKPQATCLICDGSIYGRGLCHYHYQQSREGKRIPMLPPKAAHLKPTECRECGGPHYSRELCRRHYEQVRTIERMERRKGFGLLV